MRLTKLRAVGPSPIARGVAQMPRQVWRTICRIPIRRHATGGPYTARVAFAVMAYFRSADVRPSNSVYADPIAFRKWASLLPSSASPNDRFRAAARPLLIRAAGEQHAT